MTGWVASLSAEEASNWEICRTYSVFGTPTARGVRVRTGDELFMWRAQEGLFAYCTVVGDAERAADAFVPWPNPERYRYVFPIDIVEELPAPLPLRWAELQALGEFRGLAHQFPAIRDEAVPRVRERFGNSAERLVRIDAGNRLRRDLAAIHSEFDARSFSLRAMRARQGQGAFRVGLLAAYGGRCCITGCDVEPALEAAHIAPYKGQHTNQTWNGLLLRADVHTLFDLNLVTVLPSGDVGVAPSLRNSVYASLDGARARFPAKPEDQPHPDVLREHNEQCGWVTIAG